MKKQVSEDEKVPLLLSKSQIEIIRNHVLMIEKSIENSINVAEVVGIKRKLMLSLYDLEDLEGHIAASANHSDNRKIQTKLDSLIEIINKTQRKYELAE